MIWGSKQEDYREEVCGCLNTVKSYVNGIGVGYRFERMIKLIEEERRNDKEKKHTVRN